MSSLYETDLTEADIELLKSRLNSKIVSGVTDIQCHLWEGCVDSDGYPVINTTLSGRRRMRLRAHRAWYFLHNLKEFSGVLTVSHLCHLKLCMNLSHLTMEPTGINTQRKACVAEKHCFHHGDYKDCLGFS